MEVGNNLKSFFNNLFQINIYTIFMYNNKKRKSFMLLIAALFVQFSFAQPVVVAPKKVWSVVKANSWYAAQPWLVGANFVPSSAINQLEMWQAETFDPNLIDKQLGWAEQLGMNTMRVFLHSLAYKADPNGFKLRVRQFLDIASKHRIRPMLVFFDDVWNKVPQAGKQPEPKPGVHNSGWVQDPGDPVYKDQTILPGLEIYVQDILKTFGRDNRILLWDLYNEPGNSGKTASTLPILTKVVQWARESNPDQPITIGLWAWNEKFKSLNEFQLANSDVVSYHCYDEPEKHQRTIELLKLFGKPLICTEYMARRNNSTFINSLPLLKKENVAAINWGLVDGKTNTKYAWDTPISDGSEPKEWFHEVFKKDGTPYRAAETELIKKLIKEK